jgi:4-hydroxybenzoate polyprenyltransferase
MRLEQAMSTMTEARPAAAKLTPLAVDLDGTLMRGDVFMEGMMRFLFANPLRLPKLIGWLMRGRAYAKARLEADAPTDPALLPYDERVVSWLKEERARGRTIVLATAADAASARAVADHVGVFDEVIASDGATNMKSRRKAERLAARFPDGFVYAGNEPADLKVWAAAQRAVVVNAPGPLAAAAARRFAVEKTFAPDGGALRALVKAIRPQQWAKNALVFLPLLLAQGWMEAAAWRDAALAFFALSFAASSLYLVNDASDIDADRRHHRKRARPFASGRLPLPLGLAASVALAAGGLALGALAGVLPLVIVYMLMSGGYTLWLKRKRLVDVFLLAGMYMIRIVIGGVATAHYASTWLLAFSCFFFLSLALAKRVTEVDTAAAMGGSGLSRRGYLDSDGPILKMMGVGAGFVSCLVLALYLQSDTVAANYSQPFFLWALPASVMFWLCRVWLLTDRGEMHDDPLIFAFRDWVSLWVGAIAGAAFLAAVLTPAGFSFFL